MVVVAGETGSGKTTQLPKICLELGRGIRGTIGHTQPRRLAARTVAQRIADELGTPLGEAVGYTVRFTDQASDRTLVKLMTDGILLAEIQRDRRLLRYDTLILDEAHERSLNIDFLLGYLRELLPRRPDLKVIVTSATIEPERFAAHFGGAPIVEVSGRTYPVEIRYRPLEVPVPAADDDDPDDPDHEVVRTEMRDQTEAIVDASASSRPNRPATCWCSCPASARSATPPRRCAALSTEHRGAAAVRAAADRRAAAGVRSRTPAAAIVLATNVAETSLTVPGIRYVVDTGTARICRYSRRTKVQRLPIEPISQASADQRAGRWGRVGPGVCIRLYSEEDFASRPALHRPRDPADQPGGGDPADGGAGLGDIEDVPVPRPAGRAQHPRRRALLQELGAFDERRRDHRDRPPARAAARRSAHRAHDPAGRAEGCMREVLVRPPRCRSSTRGSGRPTGRRPRGRSTPASPTSTPTSSPI